MAKEHLATAEEVGRAFGRFSDMALQHPVKVTRHGRVRTVMISADEYERLKQRDREVLDFAQLGDDERTSLIAALQAQILRADPELDSELEDHTP